MTMDFADRMGRGEQDMGFRGHFPGYLRTIGKLSLMGIIPDGEMQIHMIIRGGQEERKVHRRRGKK